MEDTEFRIAGGPVGADEVSAPAATHAALKSYAERLERANAELGAFGRVIAHDLSEGLGTIALFASTLEARLGDALEPGAARDLDGIRAGIERMWSLIGATLEAASSPVGTVGVQRGNPVDTNLVVGEAIANVEARIVQTGATIVNGPLPWVFGDDKQLTRLFQNLLSNALKSRDPARPLRIRIEARPHAQRWLFEIADNGVGIAPDLVERAFGRRRPEDPDGPLGLAIGRGIVTAHGGTIHAESRPDGGTTVSFDLPAGEPRPRFGGRGARDEAAPAS